MSERRPPPAEIANDPTVRLVTHPVTTWLFRNVFSRIDPLVFRATNGRFFSMGRASSPMLTITTIGRRSGKLRPVHLACIPYEGVLLVVASAMGQEKHPAWRYNLEAHPEVEVQVEGERYRARATLLSEEEKNEVWDSIREQIPMIHIYESRTDRNIGVFRIERIEPRAS